MFLTQSDKKFPHFMAFLEHFFAQNSNQKIMNVQKKMLLKGLKYPYTQTSLTQSVNILQSSRGIHF